MRHKKSGQLISYRVRRQQNTDIAGLAVPSARGRAADADADEEVGGERVAPHTHGSAKHAKQGDAGASEKPR